ncbi:hypothetical protein GCM10007304_36730 [Rhodococcoides trifolii]|uniref:DUF3558 domain-containing protein n=1 Tax=Rhodococcoides trifolii TaxID=908250 RepID=A0A917G2J6_9NOCA|nr:hypothetical protein [Rhodococcus trifolii]GGG19463.1 hypothetical protein GCM10007304_36730 [Rhodococcus trifolii]
MTTIRCAFLILLVLTATSCSREISGAPETAEPIATSAVPTESGSTEALFEPCSIPVTALNGVGMFSKPTDEGRSSNPPAASCSFQGVNGTLGIIASFGGNGRDLATAPDAQNYVEYGLGPRTVLGIDTPPIGRINNCIRATETSGGWVSLFWAGVGDDVCALTDNALVAIDPFLPPPA